MKRFCWLCFIVLATAVSSVRAQGPGAPQPPATQTTLATVPMSKIAVIYSAAFLDAKTGIARFTTTMNKLNAEFQAVQNELTQTATRLKALQDEINRMQQGTLPATPQQIQAKLDQFDQENKAYKRKGEDAQANAQVRRRALLGPLEEDVRKALDAYGKSRGITLIIDGSQVPIEYADPSINITQAFIADYNSKNPPTASATTPK